MKIEFDCTELKQAVAPISHLISVQSNVRPELAHYFKSLLLTVESNHASIKVDLGGGLYETKIPCICSSEGTHTFILEYATLKTFVDNGSGRLILDYVDKKLFGNVLGCRLLIPTHEDDINFYKRRFPTIQKDTERLSTERFKDFVLSSMNVMALATRSEDKRVRVIKGNGYCYFMGILASYRNLGFTASFSLDQLRVLEKCPFNQQDVSVIQNKEHFGFTDTITSILFKKVSTEDMKGLEDIFEAEYEKGQQSEIQFEVSVPKFQDTLKILKGLLSLSHLLKLYTRDLKVILEGTTVSGIDYGIPIADYAGDSFSFIISLNSLRIILGLLKDQSSFHFHIYNSKFYITVGNLTIVYGAEQKHKK